MSTESLLIRAVAEVSRLAFGDVQKEGLPKQFRNAVLENTAFMENLPISIDDTSGIATGQIQVRVERAKARGPVALVLFDYLELAGDHVQSDSEERRIGEIGRRLKHIAMACRVPVVVLSQLNRSVESRPGKMPQLSDLRYSGALEQVADTVMMLFRYDYYAQRGSLDADPARAGQCDVIIAKQRNGPTCTITLAFDERTMSFEEYQ